MHLVDWHTISKPHEYCGWNIRNLEWFGMSLRFKSLWIVLNGRGTWSDIISHKYLKILSVDDWLHNQHFPVQGTSFFLNGFIRTLSWITRQLGWKVGDGRCIRLRIAPTVDLNSTVLLPEGLRDYLYDYCISHINQARNMDPNANHQSYWLSATDLDLDGIQVVQWTDYVNGLAHGGIILQETEDTLLWMHNKVSVSVSASLANVICFPRLGSAQVNPNDPMLD